MTEDEKKVIEFVKNNPNSCVKCFMWDLVARKTHKRGMCGDCFDRDYVEMKKPGNLINLLA